MKYMQLLTLGCLLGAITFFAACGASNAVGAPEIYYGQDVCEECSMIISDAK
ncbi:protein NosL, partial [Anaerolineae bacterium CFX7]|nr:protein NosL [Anaerolineae bacterium CFX7]